MSRSGKLARACALVAIATGLAAHANVAHEPPDAPDAGAGASERTIAAPSTYADALAQWTSVDDIAAFAGSTFVYDRARALAFAGHGPAVQPGKRPPVREPGAFYEKPRGICVDLARFGVETLNRIDPALRARYLMLEFEPVVIDGATLRRHWVAAFRKDGQWWFFADSRRPGHVAGPYATLEAFVEDYARYRGRPIVAFAERDSLARRMKARARPAG